MSTGRKMGQNPHPFTVKVVDQTRGSYLTNGHDCFTTGGRTRDGSCSGVFSYSWIYIWVLAVLDSFI